MEARADGKGPDVARLVREFPAQKEATEHGELVRGLAVRLAVQRRLDPTTGGNGGAQEGTVNDPNAPCVGAIADLQLDDSARFYPSDAALAGWRAQAAQGKAAIAYE